MLRALTGPHRTRGLARHDVSNTHRSASTRPEPPTPARWWRCSRGAVGLVFSLALPVVLICAGLALDYERAVRARGKLQSLLDAATLAAVHDTTSSKADTTFAAYMASQSVADVISGTLDARVTSYNGVSLDAAATADVKSTFASLVGIDSIPIGVSSAAARAQYIELYFAIDMSSSTGMAATDADRDALQALTKPYSDPAYGAQLPNGCAFGCHHREGWEPSGKTVYQMAREAGIRLREDELRDQFNGLVDMLLDPADPIVQNGMRKISVVAFSNNGQQMITPSTSPASVKASLDGFDFTASYETIYSNLFASLNSMLGSQGTGTATDPVKTVVLITDGIDSRNAFFSQSAIDTSLCTNFKNKGFRLAVVEIKYPSLPNNGLYDDTVLPIENDISPAMEACASPGWYFQALDNGDVPAKFEELKQQIATVSVRLTR